jgi:hypothetical protein
METTLDVNMMDSYRRSIEGARNDPSPNLIGIKLSILFGRMMRGKDGESENRGWW